MKIKRLGGILFFILGTFFLPHAHAAQGSFKVGERLEYSISYMGVSIGKIEASIEGIQKVKNRDAYHIKIFVRSSPIIDVVRKVRGVHHSFVDCEHLYSLRYEVWNEQGEKPIYILDFDPSANQVKYLYRNPKRNQSFDMVPGSLDQLALGYVFRFQTLKANDLIELPLHADKKQWKIKIRTGEIKTVSNKQTGPAEAIKVMPALDFINALAKKGQVEGWITTDARRIPLSLKVRVPMMGSIKAVLKKYSVEVAE